MNPARLRAYIMLLVVTTIWGIATPIIKFTLGGIDPSLFLAYRFGISTVVAIILFFITGLHIPKSLNLFLLMLLYGFLNSVIGLGLLFFGMENTTVLESSLITLSMPLIISTAGVYFLHEHITKREKIGMAIAMLGTLLTIVEPLINNGQSILKLSGNLLIFGYVISTLIVTIIGKKLLKEGVDAMTMTSFSFILGFLCFLPIAIITSPITLNQLIYGISPAYHAGVWYMALLSGTLAFYLGNRAQKTIEIGEQSLFSYLYPIFALPLAVFWLGEKITPYMIVGGVVIAIGVIIAEVKNQPRVDASRGGKKML
jgi:drug/metabolite transporter (DMT)-like permease